MKTIRLSNKRLLLEFPTRKEMTLTMFRLSEFKEGDKRLRKYYTPDVFIDIWSDEKGHINYWEYWEGFNISKESLFRFKECFRDNLSKRELEVIKAADDIDDDGNIITCEEGDEMTLKHETSHSLYFENEEFRNKAIEIVNSIKPEIKDKYLEGLKEMGYDDEVITDEMHAYLVAYDQDEWDECFSLVKPDEIKPYVEQFDRLFNEYNKKQ